MLHHPSPYSLFAVALLLQLLVLPAMAIEKVYPGKTWQWKKPHQVGMDASKLEAFSNYVGGRGCVVRFGYMVYGWGDVARRGDVASACKPWYSHFLFKAVEEGKLKSVDELVIKFEPRLEDLNPKLGFKDRRIRWRDLANQTSCYGITEGPGTAFDYNDWQMALFWDTLFLKVYGATYKTVDAKVLQPKLTRIIQCQDKPTLMAFGTEDRPGRVGVSVRDFCRLGLLYLHKGNWKGRQLISPAHATLAVTSPLPNSVPRTKGKEAEMVPGQRSIGSGSIPDNQCDHLGSYSWLWWTNGIDREGKRHWPDVPVDTYGAFGHGGIRVMVVIPGLDLVMSWNDSRVRGREKENQALKLLVEAVVEKSVGSTKPTGPMKGQIIVDPEHPQWLRRHTVGPFFMCGPGDPEGFLYRGSLNPDGTRNGDQMALIKKLAGTGANCIYLMAVRSHGGDGDRTHNPFIDKNPSKGINTKLLDQWESWFSEMDKNGIVIFFFLYDDSCRVWKTGDRVGDQERQFIRTLVDRFQHHKNLIWCIAEEYQEAFSAKRVSNIAAEIRAADDHNHVIAVHKLSGLDFSEFADDPNIDQFAIQYNADSPQKLHTGVVSAWKKAAGRYNLNMAEAASHGAGTTARKKNWATALGGAYVMVLGMDIAGTALSDLEDCGRLVRFMESTNFHQMLPHDELASGGTEYALAKPGHSYIAYTSKTSAEIGLKGLPGGTYTFEWFDCVTGKTVIQKNVKLTAGDHTWKRPEGLGGEVALYLRRSN